MAKKMVGRVAVKVSEGNPIRTYTVSFRVNAGEYSWAEFKMTCQDNGDDCAYALTLSMRMDQPSSEALAIASRIFKASEKEQAPRARMLDGKAFLDQCALARLLQASEKLGLHVSRFSEWSDAHHFLSDAVDELPQPA